MAESASDCRVCAASGDHRSYDVREMQFGTREVFTYFLCRKCGCLQIEEVPGDLERHYPPEYYSFTPPPRPAKWTRRVIARARDRYAVFGKGMLGRHYAEKLPHHTLKPLARLALTADASILDVGSGAGGYLRDLGDLGFEHVLGIDPRLPRDVVHDNGVRVERRQLGDVDGTWDVITFHHSFEHMEDPHAALAHVGRLLAPEGTCLLRLPTVSSHAWEHYGVNWVQLDAPRHLFLHSEESLRRLAERAMLRIADVVDDSTAFQFWGSEQYVQDIAQNSQRSFAVDPANSPFTSERIAEFERQAQELNAARRGDQAAFYLRPVGA